MGNRSAKPSTQTYHGYSINVPPSEPVTPTTTSSSHQHVPCPLSTPTVSNAEWDECMRQSILTIGSTTITAVVAGLMVPAAEALLLIGTGAGVLLSVKRCRTLMRDGILSPEQAKSLEHKKIMEREEKRRQRKMEKEEKQKAAAEQKLLAKQKKIGNKKVSSDECCTKLKKVLEQKGVSVDDVPCEKLSHNNEGPHHFKEENPLTKRSQLVEELKPQVSTLQDDQPTTEVNGSISKISYTEQKGDSPRILPEITNPQQLKSSGIKKHEKTLVKQSDADKYSTVKLFAPYSRYMSESIILTCDRKECTCNSNKDDSNCTCDPEHLSFGELQQYTLATDAENKDAPLNEDPENLVVHHIKSTADDTEELEENPEVEVSANGTSAADSLNSKSDVLEQPVQQVNQINVQESEEDEEEVEVILSTAFDTMGSLNDDSNEFTVEGNEELDIKIEESQEDFDVEVMKNDIGDEQVKQLKNEVDVVFAETYKSESWPFSFSLPSLEKFSTKKNNTFKWPPLTSSIIVKPRKEPTCKCSDGSGSLKESGNAHKGCTCDSSKNK